MSYQEYLEYPSSARNSFSNFFGVDDSEKAEKEAIPRRDRFNLI